MRTTILSLLILLHSATGLFTVSGQSADIWKAEGLEQNVTITRDPYGVNHIEAQTEHDLFFTQGYCAAADRLFQLELWRRQATGTLSEVFGRRMLKKDIGCRLFRYRGDMEKELNHYHPRGAAIIRAFTQGINAYIRKVLNDPASLPLEFRLLDFLPGYWTERDVISRHQGLLGNSLDELELARLVVRTGTAQARALTAFGPGVPDFELDPSIPTQLLDQAILGPYEDFRAPVTVTPEDITIPESRATARASWMAHTLAWLESKTVHDPYAFTTGSNNWVISGKRTASGFPLLANDPHRAITIPSLRYVVHLKAPGWHVTGGGEPAIPGVSIGHNEHAAWGLTIFSIDSEDLMVYDLNPDNYRQYRYKNQWKDFEITTDTIQIKGENAVVATYRYTLHGPVTYLDTTGSKAVALRCAWLEAGGAPYLASLRMNQSASWAQFREACSFSHIPGENMVWADEKGNIGWQVVGIAPVRRNWSGLLPVPGNGTHEWDGYLPVKKLPHLYNPREGFIATANENNVPKDFRHRNAVGWAWADSSRVIRIREMLRSNSQFTVSDAQALQTDYLSLPARSLVPQLAYILPEQPFEDSLRNGLLRWDFRLDPQSTEAALYVIWERKLADTLYKMQVPPEARPYLKSLSIKKTLEYFNLSQQEDTGRRELMRFCFSEAVRMAIQKMGPDPRRWTYGQEAFHHSAIRHLLHAAVNDSLKILLNTPSLPRGGYGNTPGATSNADNQSTGASFRLAVDLSNWESAVFTNTPGQSGNPESPYYKDLFPRWAKDQYFPLLWNAASIDTHSKQRVVLVPE